MKAHLYVVLAITLPVLVLCGCGRESESTGAAKKTPPGPTAFLANAGKTPEATFRAYFHYKDRGDTRALRTIVAQNSLSMLPGGNTQGMSTRAQKLRGIVVDHAQEKNVEAIVYYRSWFSLATKARGGGPYVAKLVKEAGRWKFDIQASVQMTMAITKGKDNFGFYDGTKQWWK